MGVCRGRGLLAVVAVFPVLACCACLAGEKPEWMLPTGLFVSLLVAGSACIHYGNKWNRPAVEHTLCYLPLQAWGWLYLSLITLPAVIVCGFILAYGVGVIRPVPGTYDPNRPVYMGIAAAAALGVAGVVGWGLIRASRRQKAASLAPHTQVTGTHNSEPAASGAAPDPAGR
jgi:hypothetical protein